MLMPIKGEMEHRADLVHQARHFRTVLDGFSRNVALLYSDQALQPMIDSVALATAFAKWREVFDATRPYADVNRPDFVIFSAGLLMKEMLVAKALVVSPDNAVATSEAGLAQWPEGYAYASFCLSMAEAVLEAMGQHGVVNDAIAAKPDFWNSFRENATENAASVLGFFDILCGVEPNWEGPDVFWFRPGFKSAQAIGRQ
jgi:hypothetical protein